MGQLSDHLFEWRPDRDHAMAGISASEPAPANRAANFLRWATTHHHAPGSPPRQRAGPAPLGPLDQDRRWADTRRLLHHGAYPTADRVAGLLVLLYAQKLNVFSTLTTQHLSHSDGQTLLALGSRSVVLPAPLNHLVNQLADTTALRRAAGHRRR